MVLRARRDMSAGVELMQSELFSSDDRNAQDTTPVRLPCAGVVGCIMASLDRGTGRDRAGQCHGFSRTADISARHFRNGMSECAGLSRSSTSQRRRVLWLTPIMSAAAVG